MTMRGSREQINNRLLFFVFLGGVFSIPRGSVKSLQFSSLQMKYQETSIDPPSATVPDWRRERLGFLEWSPGKRLLASIRDYQRWDRLGTWLLPLKWWAVLRHRVWSVATGADIPLNTAVGGGLLLPHPNGIVLHPNAFVGPNCLIFQQVTLGTLTSGGAPHVGGHVDIGAGAKLLGSITIGDHAVIGANAVVLCDVPAHHVAVGIPARCRPRIRDEVSDQ